MREEVGQVRLGGLLEASEGRPEVAVGLIDGPADLSHPDLSPQAAGDSGTAPSRATEAGWLHGTFLAGLLFARRDSQAPGLVPGCTLLPRAVSFRGIGELADAIVEMVEAGARVINLSLGPAHPGLLPDPRLYEACDHACRRGALLVAAAGDKRGPGRDPLLDHPWILPVAACDSLGRLNPGATFSLTLARRGLSAPGRDVLGLAPGGGYTRMSGSSVAAAWVTGTIALLASLVPGARPEEIRAALLYSAHRRTGLQPPLLDAEATWKSLCAKGKTMMTEASEPLVGQHSNPVAPPSCGCSTIAAGEEPPFIYALGAIQPRFASKAVEAELAQAARQGATAQLTDTEVLYQTLKANRYLAREVCWVFTVEGIDLYLLQPRDSHVLDQLVEAVRPSQPGTDCDVIIGLRGPVAPPDLCNGIAVPMVMVDQVYSFEVPDLLAALPQPEGLDEAAFRRSAEELFHRVLQMADNVGALDEHRALNYLAVRYPRLYEAAAEMLARDSALTAVDVRPSRLSASRRLLDVVLQFTHRKTDVTEKLYVRVDVSEKFPFLSSKLAPYYDR